jgi:AraC-like DNA-binding protein
MHPRGGFGLVFNLGGSVRLDGQAFADPVFLDGTTTISRTMGFLGAVDLIGIRFHEGGAYPILGLPLAELRNAIAVLDGLDRSTLLRLAAQLHETKSLRARILLLEAWLMQQLALGKERNAIIPASLMRLRERAEPIRMPELAREFAISQRQLERLYQHQVGMSPKQYTQLLRVETARLALKRGRKHTSYLAAELGFYDQSHFIREFSAVVGMTPATYMKRKHSSAGIPQDMYSATPYE